MSLTTISSPHPPTLSGFGIATGSTVASITTYTQTGTASAGASTIALGAITNVAVGQGVSGTGIAYATTVTALNTPSANDITISVPTTSALSGVTLAFSGLGITLSAATTTGELQ